MSKPTIYLISGANRGIGFALTKLLASRPDTVVFAGTRRPADSPELTALAANSSGRVHVVPLVSADVNSNTAAAETIRKVVGKLDVVIANAGINDKYEGALDVEKEDMIRHFDVNVNGSLVLFQATFPLLRESAAPKFIAVSSGSGSITTATQWPGGMYAYGVSKAALNWMVRKLHKDFEQLIVFPINPGLVKTSISTNAMEKEPWLKDIDMPLITLEESARGIMEQVDVATRETYGGKFVDYTGLGKWEW
ncbi:hypothetical protein BD626DRAFT_548939 [Schizophyllum amplum]|uniref:NAD(P)-binding protein n=1 Tax=Schizophyllum amplum TaxID=97359 RepID=A0A550CAH5_9AGAR|nr:hypothetical protein BD626DRAFT_548939 [Auriculariopsis ampla]